MFDRKKAVFKKKELDLNEIVENAAHSFSLRVEHMHCQLGARCPKLAILEVLIFMYLLVKASSLKLAMPTRGRVAPR